jgi:hypothetical protein
MPIASSSSPLALLRSLSRVVAHPIRAAETRRHPSLNRTHQLREAVLLAFCDPLPPEYGRLWHLTEKEWLRLLYWLDTSGLALYFFDRVIELGQCKMLPPFVFARLQQNVEDNTARMDSMLAELTSIHQEFESAGLTYALLKGFSLWPVSVPKPQLRSQLDLDFLMAEQSVPRAREILEARGYRLYAVSGRSWEFKANAGQAGSMKDLYKATPQRTLELHVETPALGQSSLLARSDSRCFEGVDVPVLAPADLFLGQGLHLYKHVVSEFFRVAHLIEFRRHVIARYDDSAFWTELQELAEHDSRASFGLGVVTRLISQEMGDFAPQALTSWTADRLPAAARLWISMYGLRVVLASFPGSKLYLLLQNELAAGSPGNRSLQRQLVPRHLPPAIAHASKGESFLIRVRRHRKQYQYVLFRFRFHVAENLRYLYESTRWRRFIKKLDALEAAYERVKCEEGESFGR